MQEAAEVRIQAHVACGGSDRKMYIGYRELCAEAIGYRRLRVAAPTQRWFKLHKYVGASRNRHAFF